MLGGLLKSQEINVMGRNLFTNRKVLVHQVIESGPLQLRKQHPRPSLRLQRRRPSHRLRLPFRTRLSRMSNLLVGRAGTPALRPSTIRHSTP